MFYTKKIREKVRETIDKVDYLWSYRDNIFKRLNDIEKNHITLVPCDICKCRIAKEDAIKGEEAVKVTDSRIKSKNGKIWFPYSLIKDVVIHTPYYCLRCKKK
jgi:hypothetical protein